MASPFDSLFTRTAGAAIFAVHGRCVTRWPRDASADAEEVQAVWDPEDSGTLQLDRNAEEVILRGKLQVDACQEVYADDTWLIDELAYQVESIADPLGGLRTLVLTRTQTFNSTRTTDRR